MSYGRPSVRADAGPEGARRCAVVLSAALTSALLLVGPRASDQEPRAAADVEAAEVLWSYDTGG
jgi:hypothetical protein